MKENSKQLGQYIFDNHNFDGTPVEFLKAVAPLIGNIVHSFNLLDERLNSAICEIINEKSDEIGTIIIYKMNFSAKVELFFRLVRSLDTNCGCKLSDYESLKTGINDCATLRNAVIHAEWENMDNEGYICKNEF